jgi:hypothetical protein
MKITISFQYDTETRVSQVISTLPRPPFGIGEVKSILFDGHYADDARKVLQRAVKAALAGKIDAITGTRQITN